MWNVGRDLAVIALLMSVAIPRFGGMKAPGGQARIRVQEAGMMALTLKRRPTPEPAPCHPVVCE